MTTLILGGYGNVGSMIAAQLIDTTQSHIIIAGRRDDPAADLIQQRGWHDRASVRQIDTDAISDYDAALHDVDLVIVCFDLADDRFPRACLQRGIDYIDISAEPDVLKRVAALDSVAVQHDATALISVGLIPGISNLMAQRGQAQLGGARRVDNAILLGLGESFGSASADWSLSHLADRYPTNRTHMDMGASYGRRAVYRFAFADQYIIPDTLGIPTAASWGCYDNALSTAMIGVVRTLRLGWLLDIPTLKALMIRLIQQLAFGTDDFVLTSRVTADTASSEPVYQAWLSGSGEAEITALIAATTAQHMLNDTDVFPAGVHHSEQVLTLDDVLPVLKRHGVEFHERTP